MTTLVECLGCTRHVRVEDPRCPFCGRVGTTAAPSRMLALALPLSLMACTGGEPVAPAPAPAPAPVMTAPPVVAPPVVEPIVPEPTPAPDDAAVDPVQPSTPADDGAVVDDPIVPESAIDHPPTKYGGPPRPDGPEPAPDPLVKPSSVTTGAGERQPRKYGAPPRPPTKYGAAPRPDDDPFG